MDGLDVSLIPTWILIWLDHILALHKNAFMGIDILNLPANEKQKMMMDNSNPAERRAETNTVPRLLHWGVYTWQVLWLKIKRFWVSPSNSLESLETFLLIFGYANQSPHHFLASILLSFPCTRKVAQPHFACSSLCKQVSVGSHAWSEVFSVEVGVQAKARTAFTTMPRDRHGHTFTGFKSAWHAYLVVCVAWQAGIT